MSKMFRSRYRSHERRESSGTGNNIFKNRKKRRKEERKAKKAQRNSYYLNKSKSKNESEIKPNTKNMTEKKKKMEQKKKGKSDCEIRPSIKNAAEKKKKAESGKHRKSLTVEDVRKLQLKEANDEDEKAIKRLEKQLKLNKRRKKNTLPKSFAEDGLGYVLEVLDRSENLKAEGHLSDAESELSDDLARALGKEVDSEQSDVDSDHVGDRDTFFESEPSQTVSGKPASVSKSEKSQDLTDITMEERINSSEDDSSPNDEEIEDDDTDDHDSAISLSEEKPSSMDFNKKSERLVKNFSKGSNIAVESSSDKSSLVVEGSQSGDLVKLQKNKPSRKNVGSEHDETELNVALSSSDEDSNDSEKLQRRGTKRLKVESSKIIEPSDEINSKKLKRKSLLGDEEKDYWEDIYGRLRDRKGNVVKSNEGGVGTKYVPPAKRDNPGKDSSSLQLQRLRRQLKGLLNRLSESNVQPVSNQIENMYMNHSRNDMNQSLVALVLESVISKSLTPERLVMEHSLLVALLHANVGMEVGAHFLQLLVKQLDSLFTKGDNYGEEKECDNLLLLILHLYTFKVTSSILIFDILKKLGERFEERDIELILLTLRSVGFQLRKDNPLVLKELIITLQNKAALYQHDQARIRFMLETLMALRNNNMHKIPNYDPSLAEHLKKVLRGLLRKGCHVQELSISLDDLLHSEEQGRWWIVGSAWSGKTDRQDKEATSTVPTANISEKILDLATKQRMNTDIRKAIFCILMTAEDFMDAFEKLLHLNLKNQQGREIIHVTLDCCLQEKHFNRYYALLLEKFCNFDRRLQMTLQFSLWDKFKELDSMNTRQMANAAQLLVHLLTNDSLPLSVLKVIQLSEMNRSLVKFLRQVMLGVLLHDSEETCRKVFARIAPAPKLQMLREGLRLFVRHFLLRNKHKLDPSVAEKLEERAALAETALLSSDKKLKL